MAEDVTLSAAVRTNQRSLLNVADLMARADSAVGTPSGVTAGSGNSGGANSGARTDIHSFAGASRPDLLTAFKHDLARGIGTLTAATGAIRSMEGIVGQLKGLLQQGAASPSADAAGFAKQFNDLRSQIDQAAGAAGYEGINLVSGSAQSLSVTASADGSVSVTLVSVNFSAVSLGIGTMPQDQAGQAASFQGMMQSLNGALATLQKQAGQFGDNIAQLQSALGGGGQSQNGTSELNAEGASLLALQTRQQLGGQSLSFAGSAEQSVLGLFRS